MKHPNLAGGGAQTNYNGLHFEQTTSLEEAIKSLPNFKVQNDRVFENGKEVALLCGKGNFYRNLLIPKGIKATNILSKMMYPDDAIIVGDTVFIIEKKFQKVAGSVDEKLQTCDFKKKQYSKLLSSVSLKVEYIYIFNDWFLKPQYDDVRKYIISSGCHYFFNEIPLDFLGLI